MILKIQMAENFNLILNLISTNVVSTKLNLIFFQFISKISDSDYWFV